VNSGTNTKDRLDKYFKELRQLKRPKILEFEGDVAEEEEEEVIVVPSSSSEKSREEGKD